MTLFIYTDGAAAANPGPMGIGIVVFKKGKMLKEVSEYLGNGTNNIAEYKAVIKALELALSLGESDVVIRSDSELLIKQVNGKYKIKAAHLKKLKAEVDMLKKNFTNVKFEHIPRERNKRADELSKAALMNVRFLPARSSTTSSPAICEYINCDINKNHGD
jgi:ribonuclease HI